MEEVKHPQLKQYKDSTGCVYTLIPEGFNRFTIFRMDVNGGSLIVDKHVSDTELNNVYDMPVPIEVVPDEKDKAGVDYIRDERHRQIHVEGFSPEGDSIYQDGQLAFAAATYALPEVVNKSRTFKRIHLWPWAPQWWKPSINDRIKELAKAGALIAAEIDRLLKAK